MTFLRSALPYRGRTIALTTASGAWIFMSLSLLRIDPFLAITASAAPLGLLVLVKFSVARMLWAVVGGMFVLGSSSDLSSSKLIYAAVLALCVAIAAIRLAQNPPEYASYFAKLIPWGAVVGGVIAVSFVASPLGTDFPTFARQSVFYLLLVAGVLIALDTGRDIAPRTANIVIAVLGVTGAIGFAVDWLNRRGVTALNLDRFVVASLLLPALAFGLALVLFSNSRGKQKLLWIIPLVAIPISMLVTGTRTNLIIFGAIAGIVGKRSKYRVPLASAVSTGAVTLLGFALLFPLVASVVINNPEFLNARIRAAFTVLSGDGEADQSFAMRASQYENALAYVGDNPWLGLGLGYVIPVTIDSPLLTVVRLGWLGTAVIVGFMVALSYAIYRSGRETGHSPAHTAWWGLMAVALFNIPFGTPFEDRGFGLAVLLAVTAISSNISHRQLQQAATTDRPDNMDGAKTSGKVK